MSYKPRMINGHLRLLLAMREPYLTKLLDGSKTVEVRRTRPAPSTADITHTSQHCI